MKPTKGQKRKLSLYSAGQRLRWIFALLHSSNSVGMGIHDSGVFSRRVLRQLLESTEKLGSSTDNLTSCGASRL